MEGHSHINWNKYNLPRYLNNKRCPPRTKKGRGRKYNRIYLDIVIILKDIQKEI